MRKLLLIVPGFLVVFGVLFSAAWQAWTQEPAKKPSLLDFEELRKIHEPKCGTNFVTVRGYIFVRSGQEVHFKMHTLRKTNIRNVILSFGRGKLPTL